MTTEATSVAPNSPSIEAPYVGLRPYDREERHLFFGRDRDAVLLCNKIFSSRLTLCYGPSGVGKSSSSEGPCHPTARGRGCARRLLR